MFTFTVVVPVALGVLTLVAYREDMVTSELVGGGHAVYGLGLIRPWSWTAWCRDMPAFRDVCDGLLGLLPQRTAEFTS